MTFHLSRRTFLRTSAAVSARLGMPLSAGGSLAFAAKPALAVDPLTVVVVAQVGLSLYRASRDGGGGVASLLRQQTQMLREISEQLTVVDQRLRSLYIIVHELRDLVRNLPSETVRNFYIQTLSGGFRRATEIMQTAAAYRESHGVEYAISKVKDEAKSQVLDLIRNSRSTLMNDSSVVVIPIVCAAWYTEFQLMVSAVDYDRERIRSSAAQYLEYIASREQEIVSEIGRIERDAQVAAATVATYGRWQNYSCYTDIADRSRSWQTGGGGGPFGGRDANQHEHIVAEGSKHTLSSSLSPISQPDSTVALAFNDLRDTGVAIPPEIDALATRRWDSSMVRQTEEFGRFTNGDSRAARDRRNRWISAAAESSCSNLHGDPRTIAAEQNELTETASLRASKALAYYSFKLCCRDARSSIERAMQVL